MSETPVSVAWWNGSTETLLGLEPPGGAVTNLIPNPRGRDTSGTVNVDGTPKPKPVGVRAENGIIYYSAQEDAYALLKTAENPSVAAGNTAAVFDFAWTPPKNVTSLIEFWSDLQEFRIRAYMVGQYQGITSVTGGRGVSRNYGSWTYNALVGQVLKDEVPIGSTFYFRIAIVADNYTGGIPAPLATTIFTG